MPRGFQGSDRVKLLKLGEVFTVLQFCAVSKTKEVGMKCKQQEWSTRGKEDF